MFIKKLKNKAISSLCVIQLLASVQPAFSASTDRVTEIRYADLASILLNLYSLSEAEEAHRKRTADHVNAAVQDANVVANEEKFKEKKVSFKKLTDFELLSAAFKSIQFMRSYRSDELLLHSLAPTIGDLEFFNLQSGLFSKIDKTVSVPGKIVLASMIANPLVHAGKMETRKNLLNTLIQNEELFNKIGEVIKEFSEQQDALFSYYADNSSVNALLEKKIFKPIMGVDLRKHHNILHFYHRMVGEVAFAAAPAIGAALPLLAGFLSLHSSSPEFRGQRVLELDSLRVNNLLITKKTRLEGIATGGAISLILSSFALWLASDPQERRELIRYVHRRTIALTSVIRTAAKLQDLIAAEPALVQGLKNSTTYSDLLNNKSASSKTFNKIREELFESDTFTGIGRYWYVNLGRVFKVDTQVRQTLNDFAPFIEMIGEMDAYLSVAKLVKDSSKSGKAVFSLVEAVSNETEPKLMMDNFWHPALNEETVVTNTMKFKDGFRGIILTGSNTGGKSTSLKAMLLAALLGQGIGVAAAEKVILTPFAFIGSFMNITDDIKEKASLFQAEIDRARKLIEIGKDVARHQKFGIVVMDELFTGTNPKQGSEGSEKVANKLFINTNLITLFATHYDNMPALEAQFPNKQVLNYKIDVKMNDKGRYIHTYKLERGVSEVGIADYLYDRDL